MIFNPNWVRSYKSFRGVCICFFSLLYHDCLSKPVNKSLGANLGIWGGGIFGLRCCFPERQENKRKQGEREDELIHLVHCPMFAVARPVAGNCGPNLPRGWQEPKVWSLLCCLAGSAVTGREQQGLQAGTNPGTVQWAMASSSVPSLVDSCLL